MTTRAACSTYRKIEVRPQQLAELPHRSPEMEAALEKAVEVRTTRPEFQGQAICHSQTLLARCYQRQLRLKEAQSTLQEAWPNL